MAKILIIENGDIGEIISYLLQEDGHDTILVPYIITHKDVLEIMPDMLIVHEHVSKELTGSKLIAALKLSPITRDIITILCSTHPDINLIAARCGADGHLPKPFDIYKLSEMVNDLALKRR